MIETEIDAATALDDILDEEAEVAAAQALIDAVVEHGFFFTTPIDHLPFSVREKPPEPLKRDLTVVSPDAVTDESGGTPTSPLPRIPLVEWCLVTRQLPPVERLSVKEVSPIRTHSEAIFWHQRGIDFLLNDGLLETIRRRTGVLYVPFCRVAP